MQSFLSCKCFYIKERMNSEMCPVLSLAHLNCINFQFIKHCTLMWWEGLFALVILEAIRFATSVPGEFNGTGQVFGGKPDKL